MNSHAPYLIINDPVVGAWLLDSNRAALIEPFLAQESTVREAARARNVSVSVMAYWVNRFVQAGLLRVTEGDDQGRRYTTVADELLVDIQAVMPLSEFYARQFDVHWQRLLDNLALEGLRRADDWHLHFVRRYSGTVDRMIVSKGLLTAREESNGGSTNAWGLFRLNFATARAFQDDLESVYLKYRDLSPSEDSSPRFLVHVGFTRLIDEEA